MTAYINLYDGRSLATVCSGMQGNLTTIDVGTYGIFFSPNERTYYGPTGDVIASYVPNPVLFAPPKIEISDYITQVSSSFPPPIPGTYVVSVGDSFASISQRLYGDSAFAQTIANYNYYPVNASLTPGIILELPQIIPLHNNYSNAKPYDQFINTLMKNLYPVLQAKQPPPPPKHDDNSFLGELIDCIVMVAAAVIAPELAAVMVAQLAMSAAVAAVVAAATTAALASAVTQGVAIGLGLQEHFSLKGVVESGIVAGLTAGMMPSGAASEAVNGSKTMAQVMEAYANNALQYGQMAVTEQLLEMAAGVRKQFNFRDVINVIATSMIDSEIGMKVSNQAEQNVIKSLDDNIIGAKIDGQHVSMEAIAAQAIGTTLGEDLAAPVARDLNEESQRLRYENAVKYMQALGPANTANTVSPTTPTPAQGISRYGMFGSQMQRQQNATSYYGSGNGKATSKLNNNSVSSSSSSSLDEAGEKNSWTEKAHSVLGVAATGAGTGEFSHAVGDKWKGKNNEWYDKSWGGNQYTSGRNSVLETADKFSFGAKLTFFADVLLNAPQAYDDYENGQWLDLGKVSLDVGMGAVGLVGPVGFAISTTYFVADEIGWNNAVNSLQEANEARMRGAIYGGFGVPF